MEKTFKLFCVMVGADGRHHEHLLRTTVARGVNDAMVRFSGNVDESWPVVGVRIEEDLTPPDEGEK